MMGLFAWRFGNTMHHHADKVQAGQTPMIEYAWEVTNIAMSLIASLCTFVDAGRYYTESLTPWTMLFTHIVKATCAFAILALDVAVYVILSEEKYSLVGIALDSLFLLLTGVMATYAFLAYRRLSAYDDYAHPANVKGYGFNDDCSTYGNTSYLPASKRSSIRSSSGRLSIGSVYDGTTFPAVPLDILDTTPYHHQRDTQFDDYMAQRNSFHAAREAPSIAGDYFARSSPPGGGSPKGLSPQTLSPGVQAKTTLQRGPSTRSRAVSWSSDHVLVAVPEEEDEAETGTRGQADQVSLLSPDGYEVPGSDGPRVTQETDIPEPQHK
ncbi:hypothetical protein ISF_00236 [Cordyceps fumosorosea ARSEF 2679]|uniref:Uncharacterized protein n=1 Tax=Cordyceps fumosorosea (strain ARSEF 2679) TaxID=1081104 RepID=A0A168E3M0_CORFA|nr:hypothetical protein ISF_00236 [Cordyceps fumosorosea ARSEF 2679]OAA73335.1 hypothetical protein ISF_00236 [Cordyceps fumosorosea ARSEF 2679]